VAEDRAGLVIERAVAILEEIPLKRSVTAVLDYRLTAAARALKTIAPADPLEQAHGACLRIQHFECEHVGQS